MTPSSRRRSTVKVSPSSFSSRSRLTIAYCFLKMLVNPRLGRRRCSGIWPPSKPRFWLKPVPACWPLEPRVEVLPCPDPMPRPMRLRFLVCPPGGFNWLRFISKSSLAADDLFRVDPRSSAAHISFHDFQQMRHLLHHPAEYRGI